MSQAGSGEWWPRFIPRPPTEGERRVLRLISQVTGQMGGRCVAAAAFLLSWRTYGAENTSF
jgi:hypothetical protein